MVRTKRSMGGGVTKTSSTKSASSTPPTAEKSPFYYMTKGGTLSSVQAENDDAALSMLGGLADADPRSGVMREPIVLSSATGRNIVNDQVTPSVKDGLKAQEEAARRRMESQDRDTETDYGLDELDDEEEKLRRRADREFERGQELYDQLALANTEATKAEIGSLKGLWSSARREQERANKLNEAVHTQAGFRSGQTRYAPELQASLMQDVVSEGINKLTDIDIKYQSAISKANAALRSGNAELALQASKEAKQYYEEGMAEIQEQKKAAAELAKKAQDVRIKVSRESSIVGLIKQGVTDPLTLYDYMNYDDQGNLVGDITAEEIDSVLKRILPESSQSGSFKFSNEDVGKLMGTGLTGDEIQQMQDDLNEGGYDAVIAGLTGTQKATVSKILNGAQTGGVGGTLSLSEARGLGLPLSLVGRSEPQILKDLSGNVPPGWFIDYIATERQQNLPPEQVRSLWESFRDAVNETFISGETAGSSDTGDLGAQIDAAFADEE